MAIELAILVIVVMAILVAVSLIAIAARPPRKPVALLLEQHARYTGKAARASRRGKVGETNVWTEAAQDLWKQLEIGSWNDGTKPGPYPTPDPNESLFATPMIPRVTGRQIVPPQIPDHLLERARATTRRAQETS